MPPYRELYRPPSSRASSHPRMLFVRAMSPEQEAGDFIGTLADPAEETLTWSPLTWIANKASAAVDVLKQTGAEIYHQAMSEAKDLGSTLYAAATGAAPDEPGVIFNMASGLAEGLFRQMPEALQKKLTVNNQSNIAGYITLADGTKIAVPKAEDTQGQGEKALSDNLKASLTKANASAASDRMKMQLESQKLAISADQFAKKFALTERAAAQTSRMNELAIRATELALERETSSPAQRALWGRPSTLDVSREAPQRVVRAIGSGSPGAPTQIDRGPMYGRMVGA